MSATTFPAFDMAFWHPFGPHGRETPEEIIERKRDEIEKNGWTLWSFQHRLMLNDWHREVSTAKLNAVFAFCSYGRGAVDPAREGTPNMCVDCQSYRFVDEEDAVWHPMPHPVRVPHPFRPGQKLASAFVVQRILSPVESTSPLAAEWFSPQKGPWCQSGIPTRGEYLIRQGGKIPLRKVRAVLELKPPYLAVVSAESPKPNRFSI